MLKNARCKQHYVYATQNISKGEMLENAHYKRHMFTPQKYYERGFIELGKLKEHAFTVIPEQKKMQRKDYKE